MQLFAIISLRSFSDKVPELKLVSPTFNSAYYILMNWLHLSGFKWNHT